MDEIEQAKKELEKAEKNLYARKPNRPASQRNYRKAQDALWKLEAREFLSMASGEKTKDGIEVPNGFKPTFSEEKYGQSIYRTYGIKSNDGSIAISWNESKGPRDNFGGTSGHTSFMAEGRSFSYDRVGVDDSFYYATINNLRSEIPKQIARAKEGIARQSGPRIDIPGIPQNITVQRFEELKTQFKKTGRFSLMPSGFGTGYEVSKRPLSDRWDGRRAPAELEKLLETSPLYIREHDCD